MAFLLLLHKDRYGSLFINQQNLVYWCIPPSLKDSHIARSQLMHRALSLVVFAGAYTASDKALRIS